MIKGNDQLQAVVEQVSKDLADRMDVLSSKEGAAAFLDEQKAKAQAFLAAEPVKDTPEGYVSMQEVIAIQTKYIEAHPDVVVAKEIQRLKDEQSLLKDAYPEAFTLKEEATL